MDTDSGSLSLLGWEHATSFGNFPSFAVLLESHLYSFKHICVMKLCVETVMKILMFILFCWPSQIKEHLAKGQRMLAGDGMSQVTKTLLDLTQRKNLRGRSSDVGWNFRNVTDTFKRASYIPASDGVQVREAIPWRIPSELITYGPEKPVQPPWRIPGLAQGMLPPVGEESKLKAAGAWKWPNSLVWLCPSVSSTNIMHLKERVSKNVCEVIWAVS